MNSGYVRFIAVFAVMCATAGGANTPATRLSIPYVATRNDAVRDMLWMANAGKDDVVYDLGSGDGRIAIAAVRDFGARRAVGVDNDPNRIVESRANAKKAGVEDRVEFIEGDLFETDFSEAGVVTLFLGHRPNIQLRPRLFQMLKPGARVISHQFCMGEWEPDKQLTARTVYFGMWGEMWGPFGDNPHVPDYRGNEMHHGTTDKMTLWIMPAPVAGIWRGRIETSAGPQACKLTLHQKLSSVRGTLELEGRAEPLGASVDMWGRHVRFVAGLLSKLEIRFDGRVEGNTMEGTLAVFENGDLKECGWEAHRDKVDVAGTWEWPCEGFGRPIRIQIEGHDGRLTAAYCDYDTGKNLPITDLYDFVGGVYFTYRTGEEDGGFRIAEDTGWLIGEGIVDGGKMKGTIEFYSSKSGESPIGRRIGIGQ